MNIPLIDISPLYSSDPDAIKPVAAAIDKACRESGFFYITGHPISAERIREMRDLANAFFALPESEKQKIDISRSANHRGWGHTASEQLDPDNPFDCKESFDMALNLPTDHPITGSERPLYGPNQYPVAMPAFQQTVERHYWDMLDLGKKVLGALAVALDIDPDFFEDKFEHRKRTSRKRTKLQVAP